MHKSLVSPFYFVFAVIMASFFGMAIVCVEKTRQAANRLAFWMYQKVFGAVDNGVLWQMGNVQNTAQSDTQSDAPTGMWKVTMIRPDEEG